MTATRRRSPSTSPGADTSPARQDAIGRERHSQLAFGLGVLASCALDSLGRCSRKVDQMGGWHIGVATCGAFFLALALGSSASPAFADPLKQAAMASQHAGLAASAPDAKTTE